MMFSMSADSEHISNTRGHVHVSVEASWAAVPASTLSLLLFFNFQQIPSRWKAPMFLQENNAFTLSRDKEPLRHSSDDRTSTVYTYL